MQIRFPLTRTLFARFWRSINKEGGIHPYDQSLGQCWKWTGMLNSHGYGDFKSGKRRITAHRASWILAFGAPAEGFSICHSCDVRDCVNPSHLFLGTEEDNHRDKVRKKRHFMPVTPLDDAQKLEIRDAVLVICGKFKITRSRLAVMIMRELWPIERRARTSGT